MILMPTAKHIGQWVRTAGWIGLDTEWCARRDIPTERLSPGFHVILRDIDHEGMGWFYHDQYGVLRLPVELFIPVSQ